MARYRLTAEDVVFTADAELDGWDISEADDAGLAAARELARLAGYGLAGAHVGADTDTDDHGADEDGDCKMFVSLELEAELQEEPELGECGAALSLRLTAVAMQLLGARAGGCEFEGNWEIADAEGCPA